MANTDDDKNTEMTPDQSDARTAEQSGPDQDAVDDGPWANPQERAAIDDVEIAEQDATPEAAVEDTAHSEPAPQPAPRRRGGLIVPLIGGALAAGIGYGAAQYIQPEGWPFPGTTTGGTDVSALIDRLVALEGQVADLATRPAATQAPDIGPLQDQLSTLADQVTALETGLENARITGGGDEAAAALTAYQQEIEQMRTELSAQRDENVRLADSVAAVANEAEVEIGAALDRAAQVEARAAMMRIESALASGAPFDGALGQLSGIEVPDALTDVAAQGVATMGALQQAFPTAARAALDADLQQKADGDVANRLVAFLRSQLGARSLSPREGDDADAVLSRAEAALRKGDLDAALTELDALPQMSRAEMSGWIDDAAARKAAVAAAQTLEQALNSN